ncbi:uncharacterized protein LOC100207689 isoform X1 [Hydra vulgaris]|uniref:uncharacterized protein LOC100207689 isoform X1 n=1 Tax=Hydra vulgaris TaxID=6087 RepID=UPI001F5FD7E8|nr:protein REDUCED WALL ACETYLATION 3 [Hydra vulgaris]XP_047138646.1 protein REDUCED WALL ACETYLATION 3 [Hydra vulgaris]
MADSPAHSHEVDPDPGRLHYRDHNIYLNFLNSYGRLPANHPLTIHQKALFVFWITTALFWIIIQLKKVLKHLISSTGQPHDNINKKSPGKFLSSHNLQLVNPKHQTEKLSRFFKSPSKQISPSCSPSKRKDYLDPEAFNISLTKVDSDNVTIKVDKINEKNAIVPKTREEINLSSPKKDKEGAVFKVHLAKLKSGFLKLCTSHDKEQPSFEKFLLKMFIFGWFMFYIFLSDFLHIWPKVNKQYSRDMFVFLFFILVFVAVIFTIRKTKDKFLNRDQTEEWKGWMQVQFVWYHYFDANETFNSIRCYVGAYVWMTGFGNYIYFSSQKDYSIFRLLKMLFRLNFLVFCVMAMANHEFVRYYICAMHTYWFLSVWGVMVVLNRYNDNPKFMLLKFFIYFAINALIFNLPGASDFVFAPFIWILHDKDGTLRYWKYRAWLDHWSTLIGMFVAFNFERLEGFFKSLDNDNTFAKKQRVALRAFITAFLLAIFSVWFYFILLKSKKDYLDLHPFTSPVPIVIYIMLRNIHPVLRTHYMNLFSWLGKITLETYLSQIHIYMMGDAKNILVYLPQYPMLNFAFATVVYIAFSYALFHLTVFFSSYIFPRNILVVTKNLLLGGLWLGLCYALVYILTKQLIWSSPLTGLEFLRWNITKY